MNTKGIWAPYRKRIKRARRKWRLALDKITRPIPPGEGWFLKAAHATRDELVARNAYNREYERRFGRQGD